MISSVTIFYNRPLHTFIDIDPTDPTRRPRVVRNVNRWPCANNPLTWWYLSTFFFASPTGKYSGRMRQLPFILTVVCRLWDTTCVADDSHSPIVMWSLLTVTLKKKTFRLQYTRHVMSKGYEVVVYKSIL